MAVTWREHDGMRYVSLEYAAHMDQTASIATVTQAADIIAAAGFRPVPTLIHVNGLRPTPGFVGAAKRLNRSVFGPYDARLAVYGLSPLLRTLTNGFNNVGGGARIMAWPTQEQALDWLHKQI